MSGRADSVRSRLKVLKEGEKDLAAQLEEMNKQAVRLKSMIEREASHIAFTLRNPRLIWVAGFLPTGWRARYLSLMSLQSIENMRDLVHHWKVRYYR